jgi:hypothetical protein
MHPVPGMTVFYSRKETRTSLERTHEQDDSIRTFGQPLTFAAQLTCSTCARLLADLAERASGSSAT